MRKLVAVSALVMVLGLGCRTVGSDWEWPWMAWYCQHAEDFKKMCDHYPNIIMVCICEDHWEDKGTNRIPLHHYKGTVVKVYKGEWRVSERIGLVEPEVGVDSWPRAVSAAGYLGFVLTGEHTTNEISLDRGELAWYSKSLEPALDRVFPPKASR